MTLASFQDIVWRHYDQYGRHDLPWRIPAPNGQFDPYRVLVSEFMLQQTQVQRVIPKYEAFMRQFSSFEALARAPLSQVIGAWSGLGYNRRAKFLWQTAGIITESYTGTLPNTSAALEALPGIGPNTAAAILVYSFNQPVIFIETNIRTVFIYHFFATQEKVSDASLLPLLAETLPRQRAREWFWALMDYGTYLKQTVGNLTRASTSYTKQSAFQGSRRQIRGQILRVLNERPHQLCELEAVVTDDRLQSVLADLLQEGFIEANQSLYQLRT